jgi:hypothetical protein
MNLFLPPCQPKHAGPSLLGRLGHRLEHRAEIRIPQVLCTRLQGDNRNVAQSTLWV